MLDVMNEANGLISIPGDCRAHHWFGRIKQTVPGHIAHGFGNFSFVKGLVAAPEWNPLGFVSGSDGSNFNCHINCKFLKLTWPLRPMMMWS
jgi:hypothetical protein